MAREMKNSGVKWIGEIPNEWKIKRGKYNFEKHKFIPGSKSEQYDRLALTMNGVIHRSKDDVDGLQPKDFATYQLLRKDDLVFKLIDLQNISTSRVGLSPYTGLVSPAYIIIGAIDEIIPKYAEKYYLMLWYRNIFNILGDDGIRSNLSAVDLLNVPICYPSKNEQQAIVDFLDGKCEEIDGLLADLDAEVKTLAEYKKSIIAETVTRGLNPNAPMKSSGIPWTETIPAHWKTGKFRYKLKVRRISRQSDKQVLSVYREFGVIPKDSRDDNHNVTSEDTSKYKYVRPNDFVINKMKAWQGSMGVSEYEGIVSPAYFVYEFSDDDYNPRYFHYFMRNANNIPEYRRLSGGIREGQWDLSPYDLGNMPIIVPPKSEQNEIVACLDEKCAIIDQSIADKQTQIETLKSYKASLIYEYVTGKKQVI